MQMKKIMDILFDKFSDSLNDKETVDKLSKIIATNIESIYYKRKIKSLK